MGWITLSLRRSELQSSIADLQLNLLQLNSRRQRLSNLSNALGDGKITPNEIAAVGTELFGDALDAMGFSNEYAQGMAELQTGYYATAFQDVTQQQYYNNPSITNGVGLYFDEDGQLNTDMMQEKFYEEALEDYVNTVIMPELNELDKQMEKQKTQIETELEQQKAELDVVKQSVSDEIQKSAIKL